ncbi:hypothetical protein SAMN04487910_2127 [Aquimarina amphilecti]|uniref:Alpha-ketoglutarate decarboxylase n=1 Tax=Aquimarina amphilecti TaxID=1038014 RepID=A0A1H7NKH1_AQUAM|nr:alpha-ketoglutarate decarboxylase [Aquimarina amphilecti]SEL23986.1 hypothetical protein SAMN04487910_2127 [Aquimarina amphilecti]
MKVFLIHKIKIITLVSLILFSLQQCYSQEDNFWSRVRIGGNIGIGFTDDTFNGILAPSAIYDFNNHFSMGFGLNFGYTDSRNFTATNYGASLITLYNPLPALQLSAEFEQMGVSRNFEIEGGDISDNYWYPALFIGAGYRIGFVSVGLRYDVLYDDNKSIYASAYAPFVRVFF